MEMDADTWGISMFVMDLVIKKKGTVKRNIGFQTSGGAHYVTVPVIDTVTLCFTFSF